MRLLSTSTTPGPNFVSFANPPPYAILSHTWAEEEVLYGDIYPVLAIKKKGWPKVQFCINQAKKDGLEYAWIDTCCIDKSSSAEVAEAINSCYSWYAGAEVCYVYLEDVQYSTNVGFWRHKFRHSRWFTRGWTLPELLAPKELVFFSAEGMRLGSKAELLAVILNITAIPERALRGDPVSTFTIKERLKWAKDRETSRIEDEAYCLLGIFGVFMPIIYGEGGKAWSRLQVEIGSDKPGWPLWPESEAIPKVSSEQHIELTASALPPDYQDTQTTDKVSQEEDIAYDELLGDGQIPVQSDSRSTRSSDGDKTSTIYRSGEQLFQPLGPSSFRLLTIEPGIMGEAINGKIQEHDIAKPPSYHALSYVWGQEPPIHSTIINQNTHLIKPNLFHALQRVRLPYGQYSIWVDSMCINQNDSSERNQQVRQMSNIYGKASGVLIWLGEEDSTSKAALEYITRITDKDFRWGDLWWQDHGLLALSRLVQRPWFRRGWVLQEAASSNNSILLCGDQQVHMDYFITATRTIRDRLSNIPLPTNSPLAQFHDSAAIRLIDIVTGVFKNINDGPRRRVMLLEALVHRTTYSEVTDQRDAIYVLLNLADDGTSYGGCGSIVPDYTKPVLDVMVDFISHCCLVSGQLDIICRPWAPCYSPSRHGMISSISSTKALEHYPSWLVTKDRLPFGDPTRQNHRRLHGDPLIRRGDLRCYFAHYGSRPIVNFGRHVDGFCDGTLRAKGIVVGRVLERSARMADAIISKESVSILRKGRYEEYFDNKSLPDVVWRTLCGDRDDKGERASHFYETAMLHLINLCCQKPKPSESVQPLDMLSSIDPEELLEETLPEFVEQFLRVVRDVVWNRRTFLMADHDNIGTSLVGLGPQKTRVGDHVCILYGCSVPVVLRETDQQNVGRKSWTLIGEAYVHGIMDGEAISKLASTALRAAEMDFVIL